MQPLNHHNTLKDNIIRIAFTPGEPAGIGPDLAIMLAQQPQTQEVVVIADPDLLLQRAYELNLPIKLLPFDENAVAEPQRAGTLRIVPTSLETPVTCGQLHQNNSIYVLNTLNKAMQLCRQSCHALVTGPVHKGIINQAGFNFTGHTEYLAEHLSATPVMMLATTGLRVALVTTHIPLSEVATAITTTTLETVLMILHQDLQTRFGIPKPQIFVCGLNPHAGEDGYLGHEEREIISPLLSRLRRDGKNIYGPLSADTLFIPKYMDQADVILAMYHDQGLPVLKHAGFGKAVNITLGLPIIRTSVGHGTALELAGKGGVNIASLETAINTATTMAKHALR